MQPSFSGLFVTWAYLPGEGQKRLSRHISAILYQFNLYWWYKQNFMWLKKDPLRALTPDDLSSLCD